MKVLYVISGSGGSFYCQNCLRDTALADALRARGHAVTLLPLYLPASALAPRPTDAPVFYGAVSLYLRHRYAWLRRLPRAWFAPLDTWPVLRLAARCAGATSARGLDDLTLSLLLGRDGQQADELQLVADWLSALPAADRPDVLLLSNALLAGMAAELKRAARCPVACWLQDEHVWLDALAPEMRLAAWHALADSAREVDRFIAASAFYAERLSERLRLRPERVSVVFPGLDPDAYAAADVARRPPVVGFLSRLSEEEGFGRFVDAFLLLRRDPRFADARLAATGGPAPERGFLKRQLHKLADAGALASAAVSPDRFVRDRRGFLAELTLLCVPGTAHEAFAYFAVEALAAGVPVVLPSLGAFPEIAAAAGCMTLTSDAQPETLARAWAALLSDPARLRQESARGRAAARSVFSQDAAAAALERALALAAPPVGQVRR
jgi:glycosyltransferase involved in cell wall biosynthesis